MLYVITATAIKNTKHFDVGQKFFLRNFNIHEDKSVAVCAMTRVSNRWAPPRDGLKVVRVILSDLDEFEMMEIRDDYLEVQLNMQKVQVFYWQKGSESFLTAWKYMLIELGLANDDTIQALKSLPERIKTMRVIAAGRKINLND